MKATRFFLAALVTFWTLVADAQQNRLLSVGAAGIDVTPGHPTRLHGYGGRTRNADGVAQKIFAKALAFGTDAEGPRILITLDNLGVPGAVTEEVAARLKARNVTREHLAICASHTHSAPMLSNVAPNIFSSDIIPEQQAAINRYTRELVDKLESVALSALSNRAPAKVSWNEGRVTFAKNRRVVRAGRAQFGENDAAPVDHALPVIFVRTPDNQLRAVLANYACHCTTLGGEWNNIHGDWAGCAQEAIEREHPSAVALISIGCGADANPSPRGKLENARTHGEDIASEVRRLLSLPGNALVELPGARLKRFHLDFDPLPTEQQWKERAAKPGIVGYHAKKNLARLARGETLPTTLPYSVQTWVFGNDLAMVFLPGEVVVDYQLRLKREFDASRLWVNAYANDAPCYIPSRRILNEGGYEAEDSLWYYDRPARLAMSSEDRIVRAVHELLPPGFIAKTNRAEAPLPLNPQQALNSIRVAPEFTVELVASEPLIVDPVAIDWGSDGKLWVLEMHDYPSGMKGNLEPGGRVKFLTDTNNDGRYDRATLFLDGLPFPTGVFAWRKGVLICAAPDILYAEDTNGDGRADLVKTLFTGFATNNYQARVNSLSLGLDGWIYGANGLLGGRIRYVGGAARASSREARLNEGSRSSSLQALPGELDIRGRDFRMNPDTGAFEPASGLTQQGRVRDDFGNWFGCDNSRLLLHYPLADQYIRRNPLASPPQTSIHVPQGREWNRLYPASRTLERFNDNTHANRVTSACGLEIYRDELLGKEFYGNAFTCEPVHNLVHREVLTSNGATFRSARATNESNREFLTSTDNWFRPVQARTGPDGALWVVDMYRYVIEHPRWIPSNRLASLDVRAGDDKGRIYRVARKEEPLRPIRDVTILSAAQLAELLDSPNGTERDIIHRELLHRGDASAVPGLVGVFKTSAHPAARVQALWLVHSFSPHIGELLTEAMNAPLPEVRIAAWNIASERSFVPSPLPDLSTEPDLRVRFQRTLALVAAEHTHERLQPVLLEATTNWWMRAAILTTIHPHALFEHASRLPPGTGQVALAESLLSSVHTSSRGNVLSLLNSVLSRDSNDIEPWRFRAGAKLMRRFNSLSSPQNDPILWRSAAARQRAFANLARQVASDAAMSIDHRKAAIQYLAHGGGDGDLNVLEKFLRDSALRTTALEALLQATSSFDSVTNEQHLATVLLASWSTLSPRERERVAERCLARAEGTQVLLDDVEQRRIASVEISLPVRNRLLNNPAPSIRSAAAKLWPNRAPDRARLTAEFRKATSTPGSATRGAEVFSQHCAACHALNGRGTAIGPDISIWRDKSVDDLLLAVLDPNAAIEPRFVNYIVETKTGAVFYGVIRSETATSVELVSPGIHETLLRSDLARVEASTTSLMPEGLGEVIMPAEMNHLVAFIKKPAPRLFGSATADQTRQARAQLVSHASGRPRFLAATEQTVYPSWLGRLPFWHCRQTDGAAHVEWDIVAPTSSTGELTFTFPAAMGWNSQPAGGFTLKVNGKSFIEFDVTLTDSQWESRDGQVRMNYSVMEANTEDSNGPLTITLPRSLVPKDGRVRFEVTANGRNSQRWFGIYEVVPGAK
jgi:putative membrane-bound dehydrogenase-like protein